MNCLYYGIPTLTIGYFGYNYMKSVMLNYVLSEVNTQLKNRMDAETLEDVYKVSENGKSVRIKYKTGGKFFDLYVPYNKSLVTLMCQNKIYLVKNNSRIALNLKPGIPLMISASDLDGERIIIENLDGNTLEFIENETVDFSLIPKSE